MELYCNKQAKIAQNIFELGLKKFNTVLEFVLEYIKFLIKQNDVRITFSSRSLTISLT